MLAIPIRTLWWVKPDSIVADSLRNTQLQVSIQLKYCCTKVLLYESTITARKCYCTKTKFTNLKTQLPNAQLSKSVVNGKNALQ